MRSGYNGVSVVSERLGIHKHTVRKGKKELENEIIPREGFIRQGRWKKKTVVVNGLIESLLIVLQTFTTGNPMKEGELWTNLIAGVRRNFVENNLPVLSLDTKKKEMLGNFYREGKLYTKEAIQVNDHDFNSFSAGVVIPHGIYDVTGNTCYLSIGTSKDTAEFVSDNIEYHWNNSIKNHYPDAKKMLLLCDGGRQ